MAVLMEIFYIIIYVVVIAAILKRVKKKRMNGSSNRGYRPADLSTRPVNQTVSTATYHTPVNTSANSYGKANTATKAPANRPVTQGTGNAISGGADHATTSANASAKKSTTDYLQEKAKKDQVEHAKEKREEDLRVSKKYGGRKTAMRYLLGDPVPNGGRIFYCPYCGAENIVPTGYRGDMNCYFCRTHLK